LMANIYRNYTREEVKRPIGWDMPFLCIYTSAPNPDKVKLFFPDAIVHVEEGSGHGVQRERADIVNPMIARFVFAHNCRLPHRGH